MEREKEKEKERENKDNCGCVCTCGECLQETLFCLLCSWLWGGRAIVLAVVDVGIGAVPVVGNEVGHMIFNQ